MNKLVFTYGYGVKLFVEVPENKAQEAYQVVSKQLQEKHNSAESVDFVEVETMHGVSTIRVEGLLYVQALNDANKDDIIYEWKNQND